MGGRNEHQLIQSKNTNNTGNQRALNVWSKRRVSPYVTTPSMDEPIQNDYVFNEADTNAGTYFLGKFLSLYLIPTGHYMFVHMVPCGSLSPMYLSLQDPILMITLMVAQTYSYFINIYNMEKVGHSLLNPKNIRQNPVNCWYNIYNNEIYN